MAEVDKELAESLLGAKKTPRNFAIISKGPNVLHLIVQKKRINEGELRKAKKEFEGNTVTTGVVITGDGPELVFQVAEESPVGEVRLRKFVTETAGLTLKTTFRVVPDLQAIDDGTSDAEKAVPGSPKGDEPTAQPSNAGEDAAPMRKADSAPAPPNLEAVKFAQRLKPLKPNLDKVIAGGVSVSPAVQELFADAAEAFKQQQYLAAHAALDRLEPRIKQGLEELAAKALAAGDPMALFTARLKRLLPEIKAAAGTPPGEEAKLRTSEAGVFAQKKDFVQANSLLDRAEASLKMADSTTIPKGIVEKRQFLLTRWKQLPNEIAPHVDALINTIAVDHPTLSNLHELRAVIDKELQALFDELQDEIDRAINQGDMTVLKGLRDQLMKHDFFNHLMSNPFVSGSRFQSAILNAIQEVEARLAS